MKSSRPSSYVPSESSTGEAKYVVRLQLSGKTGGLMARAGGEYATRVGLPRVLEEESRAALVSVSTLGKVVAREVLFPIELSKEKSFAPTLRLLKLRD
ncbi:MAG: hypothetical protein QXZ60_05430 [Sulfolobales archaeon]